MKLFNFYINKTSTVQNLRQHELLYQDTINKQQMLLNLSYDKIRSIERDIRVLSNRLADAHNLCREHETELMRLGYERVK